MAMPVKEFRLGSGGEEGSAHGTVEDSADLSTDVRVTVESQFRQMEQAHDRIRAEELALRLADTNN